MSARIEKTIRPSRTLVVAGFICGSALLACATGRGGGGEPHDGGQQVLTGGEATGVTTGGAGSFLAQGGSVDQNGGTSDGSMGSGGDAGTGSANTDNTNECQDGIDNDGDGYIDYQMDPGCYGPGDKSEAALSRAEERGFTTWDFASDSMVIYVSAEGSDTNDGTSPDKAVRTLVNAAGLVRDGSNDFILLRRGDVFRDENLGRFKSGKDAEHPMVISSYGDSKQLPRIEVGADYFIDHGGSEQSYVALVGLHIVAYHKDPNDPAFDGVTGDGLRFVGGGKNLLVEGCHFEFVENLIQSFGSLHYEQVEWRRNIVEKAYHADTCSPGDPNGNSAYRPSGIYASHVNGLLIEQNLFDHNGWNEEAGTACATIYNHNIYVNANDLVIRNNVFTRSSSIHIKLRADATADVTGVTIENNFFVEGEVGISAGGNTTDPARFVNVGIRNNVLSDIGRSRPTTRTLAWGLDIMDNEHSVVEDNLFLNHHEPGVNNSHAISIAGDSQSDLTIQNNLLYRIQGTALSVASQTGHNGVVITNNSFVDPDQNAYLVTHDNSFSGYSYSNNSYVSSAPGSQWFRALGTNTSFDGWTSMSGETGAMKISVPNYVDSTRTIETYAGQLGLDPSLLGFLGKARNQNRQHWNKKYTAGAINDYIREGFQEQ